MEREQRKCGGGDAEEAATAPAPSPAPAPAVVLTQQAANGLLEAICSVHFVWTFYDLFIQQQLETWAKFQLSYHRAYYTIQSKRIMFD